MTDQPTLTPLQDANVRVATRLFNRYVGDAAKEREFERRLRRYVADHPDWNMAESAQTICNRVLSAPNYQPAGGDAAGSAVDANFSIRGQFQNEIRTALASDQAIQRLQREATARAAARWNQLEPILTESPVRLNLQTAGQAIDHLRTHFTADSMRNDILEARALVAAVDKLVNTTGVASLISAIEHGQSPVTLEGRNAARYQEAKEGVIAALRDNHVSNPQEADVTAVLRAAVPLAREAIRQRQH